LIEVLIVVTVFPCLKWVNLLELSLGNSILHFLITIGDRIIGGIIIWGGGNMLTICGGGGAIVCIVDIGPNFSMPGVGIFGMLETGGATGLIDIVMQ
jgi:hypothetical protein